MKISISGSHSTGKTTLAEAVRSRLKCLCPNDVAVITETARKVAALGFPLNQDATLESYYKYLEIQLESERECKVEHVVSDRSLVDLLAYIRTNNEMRIPKTFISLVEEILRLESKYFDLYCVLPVEFELILDDIRPADNKYRKAVDKTLLSVLKEFKLPYRQVSGTLEQRIEKIVTIFGLRS